MKVSTVKTLPSGIVHQRHQVVKRWRHRLLNDFKRSLRKLKRWGLLNVELWRDNPWGLKSDHCVNSLNSVLKISNDNHDIYRLHKILIESIIFFGCKVYCWVYKTGHRKEFSSILRIYLSPTQLKGSRYYKIWKTVAKPLPVTPKIWLLILPSSCYTFPYEWGTRSWI